MFCIVLHKEGEEKVLNWFLSAAYYCIRKTQQERQVVAGMFSAFRRANVLQCTIVGKREREVTPPSHYTEGRMGNNEGFNETFISAPNLHPSNRG